MIWVWRNAISLVCIACAAVLAWRGTEGWGWFLFVAVLAEVKPATQNSADV